MKKNLALVYSEVFVNDEKLFLHYVHFQARVILDFQYFSTSSSGAAGTLNKAQLFFRDK